jgi:transcriptional regulator with XRE-family HTH domain
LSQSGRGADSNPVSPKYGRGSGVPNPVDIEIGTRIRERRLLLGMNQATLANNLDLTFQQVQKYERGINRVSASRLSAIAEFLGVPVGYFFADLDANEAARNVKEKPYRGRRHQRETVDLVRFYCTIPDERVRRLFLDLVKAIAASQ